MVENCGHVRTDYDTERHVVGALISNASIEVQKIGGSNREIDLQHEIAQELSNISYAMETLMLSSNGL